jgi:hypothetical protein
VPIGATVAAALLRAIAWLLLFVSGAILVALGVAALNGATSPHVARDLAGAGLCVALGAGAFRFARAFERQARGGP